jgi:hypothetical protein
MHDTNQIIPRFPPRPQHLPFAVAGLALTPQRDDFDAPTLGVEWIFLGTPNATFWSLADRPRMLRLLGSCEVAGGFTGVCFALRPIDEPETLWTRPIAEHAAMYTFLEHMATHYGGVHAYLAQAGLSADQILQLRRRLVPDE